MANNRDLPDLLPDRHESRPTWQRVLLIIGAVVMFVVGTVGWIVPVVAGFPFYIAAAVMLAMATPKTRDFINRLERKLSYDKRVKLREKLHKVPSKRLQRALSPS